MPNLAQCKALRRFRVLDLSRVRAGPTCVRMLADFGADVLRIEPPPKIDPNDAMFADDRLGGDFQNLNRNKRSLTLNLKTEKGLGIFMKLVTTADVVVENWRPAVKKRLGIDYESLRKIKPDIVLASIAGYGQDGPYVDRPAFDQIIQGMGGLMSVTGLPGQGPVRAGLAVSDSSTGLYAAIGILTALLERAQTGEGQWVHASLLHSQIAMMDFQAARYLNEGDIPEQEGNDHPTASPMGLFAASDGLFNIGVAGEGMWQAFCRAMGHDEWLDDPELGSPVGRKKHKVWLNETLQEEFRCETTDRWVRLLNEVGVPAGPVYSVPEVFEDPQVAHLGVCATASAGGIEKKFITQPVVLERTPATVDSAGPGLGEHTEEVLSETGYSREEIEEFRRRGVV